ncbi:D-ribose pyranase [Pantoea sp. 1.19]|uniref:D-ribose pyranase n=1 Tax=Pantoea sp. 1.19 TaxID=1925589 RepID=UPI000948C708|nr:D-ribose pyranase [Pantoea sp. 1.19]
MKKGTLLNATVSAAIARLGHTDTLTIADAGLPIPASAQRIDLALTQGVPAFIQVVQAIAAEMQVEHATLAAEIQQHNSPCHQALLALLTTLEQQQGNRIGVTYVSHDELKQRSAQSQAVVRSGECSPYANVILHAGVTF